MKRRRDAPATPGSVSPALRVVGALLLPLLILLSLALALAFGGALLAVFLGIGLFGFVPFAGLPLAVAAALIVLVWLVIALPVRAARRAARRWARGGTPILPAPTP